MNADIETDYKARMAAAEMAERGLTGPPDESHEERVARIMALPPQQRADAISALFDSAYVFLRLAARYREPLT